MLMGPEAGHCVYIGLMSGGASNDHSQVPQHVQDFSNERYPGMLSAPTEDYGPSISSLEYYAKNQTPAPAKDPAKD